MMINGATIIGSQEHVRPGVVRAINAATGEPFGPPVSESTAEDVGQACGLAAEAFERFAGIGPTRRAAFLEAIAEEILAIGDPLIEVAMAETGLPRARLEGERGRTVGQLRMFAAELHDGTWMDATIDPALPDRLPPRADLRRVNFALGPVAVFGASNFPLAFSVAGGDTASALAAGCPVVVKGHPAHPGTGELVARAVAAAVSRCDLPQGTFSFLPGAGHELGSALVSDARIRAVGFTGSRAGGLALSRIASARPEPIPVYAEMSSINPVVLLPAALANRAEALGSAFAASLTLGAGQFCTNPGLVIAVEGPDLDRFIASAAEALAGIAPAAMLTPQIHATYVAGVTSLEERARKVTAADAASTANRCASALFLVDARGFLGDRHLGQEVFGASSVIVRCADLDELASVITGLEGQLTATLQLDPDDHADAARVVPLLSEKVGRVLANGWPTGVEVTAAMVHGGPYPATTDGRSTSVGTLAMARFVRPICFQDIPDALLPPPLQAANPWKLPRRVDNRWERP